MKKIIFSLLVLAFIPVSALAWDDCPYNKVDDSYPGDCNRYVDTDNDGICDLSQPTPEDRKDSVTNSEVTEKEIHDLINGKDLKTKTVTEIAQIYQIDAAEYAKVLSEHYKVNIKQTDSFQLLHDNYAVEPSAAKEIAASVKTGQQITISESDNNRNERLYHLIPISLLLIVLYIISHVLSKKNLISALNHRRFWNILLLITFLISGILGILLVVRINFGVAIPLPLNIMFWHVEVGIAMVAISTFHTIWHWPYFIAMLKINKKKK